MQGRRDLAVVAAAVMDELVPLVNAQYGAFYLADDTAEIPELRLVGAYGHPDDGDGPAVRFRVGQSLVGQAARSRRRSPSTTCRPATPPSPPASAGPRRPA